MKLKYEKSHGGREKYYSCKYKKDLIGDCVIRSIAIATETDYREVFEALFRIGLEIGDMPNSDPVVEQHLNSIGWYKNPPIKMPNSNKKYLLSDVPVDVEKNYIFRQAGHLVAVVKGTVYDTFDSRSSAAQSYYTKK